MGYDAQLIAFWVTVSGENVCGNSLRGEIFEGNVRENLGGFLTGRLSGEEFFKFENVRGFVWEEFSADEFHFQAF